MLCKVRGCRFANTHLTIAHKCGNCDNYGHGRYECMYPDDKKLLLERSFSSSMELMSQSEYCTARPCKFPWSHKTVSHHCSLCGNNGHERTVACRYIIEKKCPICNKISTINLQQKIYTDQDCAICLQPDKQKLVFEGCKHAHVCVECVPSIV